MKKFYLVLLVIIMLFTGCHSNESSEISTYEKKNDSSISISVVPNTITPNDMTINIENNTNTDVTFDTTFVLEQNQDNRWYIINKNQYFNAIGIELKANSLSNYDVKFNKKLSEGHYRIIKPFNFSSKIVEFDVEFIVKGK